MLAIGFGKEAAAEALFAPTASAGALDVQVRGGSGMGVGTEEVMGRKGGAEGQEEVLTHAGVPEQITGPQTTLLMHASHFGMTGMVKKLLAEGAKTETADEVDWKRGWWAGDAWWGSG